MIPFKPVTYNSFICPKCKASNLKHVETIFMGMYTLAQCKCINCSTSFFHTFPIGHAYLLPVRFSDDKKYTSFNENAFWWAQPLLASYFKKKKLFPPIQKFIYQQYEEVVILICLDNCFGHSFTNLLNVQSLLKEKTGVVVVIQKSFLWLVPDGVAEVWLVDEKTKNLSHWIGNLDAFVKTECQRFKKVHLHNGYMPPDFFKIDYEKFTKTQKFNLEEFIHSDPVVTFICREDRTWINSTFENFIYLISLKFGIQSVFKKFFVVQQNKQFSKVARLIQKEVKNIKFYAAGFGNNRGLSPLIEDLRIDVEPTEELEKKWCRVYAKSHLVIGVHGSNMLIPTSLSAAFINLLPRHKITNFAEDISINYQNNHLLFLSRHLDQYASPHLVARHAVAMITKFKDQIIK